MAVLNRFYVKWIKPFQDVVISLILLSLASPLGLLVYIVSVLDTKDVTLFKQLRTGKGLEVFQFCKFRTMTNIVDSSGALLPDEERTSAIGKILRRFSLDELPTLIHVLNGKMSLVGPRPLPISYTDRMTEEQKIRFEVKPGLTGLSQVNGRTSVPWDKRLDMDRYYALNVSFMLDLRIICITPKSVFRRSGNDTHESGPFPDFNSKS